GKYREPTVCTDCGAVFHRGRWSVASIPDGAHRDRCPACRRVRDKLPAGWITLEGAFYGEHRDELLRLARHEAEKEGAEHPLNRIMSVDERPGKAIVSTTDIHTPRRIGTALRRAYEGELEIRYGDDEYSVRVLWRR
ncbi:MAG TPA: BCAM0308 family protein, partial [Casimicrobiaceae bacterium]|nr:BCAM0308 family protein [Casimicrobiaceae bacterium]